MNSKAHRQRQIAAISLGALCALPALAGQLGRWSDPLDLLNHLAPFWFAGGCLSLALAIGVRPSRIALSLGALAVLASGAQIAPVLTQAALQQVQAISIPNDATRLKVIQLSFYHDNLAPLTTVEWLLSQQADIITLQETEGLTGAARNRLFAAYPYRSADEEFVLSRWPMLSKGGFERIPGLSSMVYRGSFAVIDRPGGAFTVVGMHHVWPYSSRSAAERRQSADYVASLPAATTIVAGDFNATPWSFTLQRLQHRMGLALVSDGILTFPARPYDGRSTQNPIKRLPGSVAFLSIDNIFAGRGWQIVSVRRGPKLGSDHYPIVAVLTLRRP
jgi:endonuclease/exonuclease/phosphatase (EEP) superfamily protein YafD